MKLTHVTTSSVLNCFEELLQESSYTPHAGNPGPRIYYRLRIFSKERVRDDELLRQLLNFGHCNSDRFQSRKTPPLFFPLRTDCTISNEIYLTFANV